MKHLLKPFVQESGMEYIAKEYPSLKQLSHATEKELLRVPGLGPRKAKQLKAVFDLSKALLEPDDTSITIQSPADVFENFKYLALHEEEYLVALFLNTKNKILQHTTISKGTLNTSLIHPREVFAPAIRIKCASVVILHNHPSGDPTPSREDIDITKRLKEAGKIIGIELLDHIVIGNKGFVSLREKSLL
ncbi:RadC family protein [Dethiobacter alkaliphilus]|uniref:DNA repair protein RadC n=1 Tax=Dethiobacter alkaliphilus AHT 1 TaxID=555088 RepID=C0GE80_DETAL|nr:DNA repair protein RadC [Dethiobacter alkaliphilus]EEG78374.1 DNA repair protein RadC [Dethiobacter alkaliphilus AHT 1]